MNKAISALLALCLVLSGCGAAPGAETTELIVFAASSMTETLTELGELYTETHPHVEIVFNFDSSGTLKTQIEEGAPCDVFISAGQKQMDNMQTVRRIDLLENKIALVTAEDDVLSFDDLAEKLRAGNVLLAMGNRDVPVGQYTQNLLAYYDLDETALAAAGCITYATNAKEVVTHVQEAVADCGIVYQTDAAAAELPVIDTATAAMCGQVVYPAAVLQDTETAQDFLAFLTSDTADAVFERVGFTPLA